MKKGQWQRSLRHFVSFDQHLGKGSGESMTVSPARYSAISVAAMYRNSKVVAVTNICASKARPGRRSGEASYQSERGRACSVSRIRFTPFQAQPRQNLFCIVVGQPGFPPHPLESDVICARP